LKYYLKQFYNLNFRTFVSFYKELRNKFKVILIKDLFSFLENKVSVFMKKHVFYAFSSINNITLNMNNISASSSTLVFIGNVIGIKSTFYYFYERFMIFFNFLYFIDPILLNKKFILLSLLYKRLYNNFYNSNSLFFQLNPSYNKPFELNLFYSLKENSFISSFIQKVKYFSYNIYIKSMFFFICKYKLLSIKKSEIYKNKKTFSYNYKKLLYFFSFNKYLYKYNLINFKRSFLLKLNRKRKKIRFRGRGRRYRLFLNVFN
jgi:hypothetical protein